MFAFCQKYGQKNISKKLSRKYNQKRLDHAKQSKTDTLKTTLKRVIPKTAETPGNLFGNEITDLITNFSKILQQNNSETVRNEHDYI